MAAVKNNTSVPGEVSSKREMMRLIRSFDAACATEDGRKNWYERAWRMGATFDESCGDDMARRVAELLGDLEILASLE